MAHSVEEINKHVRLYLKVFATLLVLTGVTVAISYVHLPEPWALIVALIIAGAKGTLVAGFFMHLFDEFREKKPILFWTLVSSVTGFLFVLIIPTLNHLHRLGLH
jgi:cytochrome c oxidase subunit 4